MADPNLELSEAWRGGGGGGRGEEGGFGLLALPAFLASVISSFFTQNKRGRGWAGPALHAPPLGPPLTPKLFQQFGYSGSSTKTGYGALQTNLAH